MDILARFADQFPILTHFSRLRDKSGGELMGEGDRFRQGDG